MSENMVMIVFLLLLKLLCDEAAGLRFSPVLYPKVSSTHNTQHNTTEVFCWMLFNLSVCLSVLHQASQLIVNYDEHELNNTFKFGVIYQRFGQVPAHRSSLFLQEMFDLSSVLSHEQCLLVWEEAALCVGTITSWLYVVTCPSGVWGGAVQEQRGDAGLHWVPAAARRHGGAAGLQGVRT